MEKKINIAELLKDCPKGMELDCIICNGVKFIELDRSPNFPIVVRANNGYEFSLTKYGQVLNIDDAKCVIFPKGKTTWEVPPCKFKDGDVVATKNGLFIGIVKIENGVQQSAYVAIYGINNLSINISFRFERFATEKEKEKLFNAIKANGYKWNEETKTLEKLPKFKVDDKIKLKGGDEFGIITQVTDCFFTIKCRNNTHCWPIKKQDDWELVPDIKPKFKVGDRIKYKNGKNIDGVEQGVILSLTDDTYDIAVTNDMGIFVPIVDQDEYELVPNKFDIATLKPYESRVLVRGADGDLWKPAIYGFSHSKGCYVVGGVYWKQCIPYEANKELLGTTNNIE